VGSRKPPDARGRRSYSPSMVNAECRLGSGEQSRLASGSASVTAANSPEMDDPDSRARRPRRARDHYNRRESIAGYLFIAPWIIGFAVFTAGAMIYSLYISFSDYNLATNAARPVGFDNYANLFDDPRV